MSTFQYVIVRFRPILETGEFANVGVVVYDPNGGRIVYKLASRRFRRVTQFFENIEPHVYSESISVLDDKLSRIADLSSFRNVDTSELMFDMTISAQSGVIAFSDVRSVMGQDIKKTVSTLFERLVRRNFDSIPQREVGVAREIRKKLLSHQIKSFRERYIEDDLMPVKMPLVSGGRDIFVIKPIAFDQKTTLSMIDHANLWTDRFKYYISNNVIRRENILIPVERSPISDDPLVDEAFRLSMGKLMELSVGVVDYNKSSAEHAILEFALKGDLYGGELSRGVSY
ncbi:MAG: DUF3037 domain-containing protein [Sphingomonas bacterium]